MFCPNCGKEIKENDNFCRFCGTDLRINEHDENVSCAKPVEEKVEYTDNSEEEYVLYDVQKHWMSLAVLVFLVPLFLFYFWSIFLNSHSFFSWVVVIALLILIIYPIGRYKSDKIIITNKFAHVKIGIINPEEIDIPLNKLDMLEITQSSKGRMLGYGQVSLLTNVEKINYGYIENPEDLQYIIDDPQRFIQESV